MPVSTIGTNALTTGLNVSSTDIAYTGTLTGGTGVVNIGSGQVYKNSSGDVGLGTTSPASSIEISRGSTSPAGISLRGNGNSAAAEFYVAQGGLSQGFVYNRANEGLYFGTNNAERMRLDTSGNLLLGTTTASAQFHISNSGGGGTEVMRITTAGGQTASFYYPSNGLSGTGPSATAAVQRIWRDATTARSINAAGTVNASGADYAEYMTKAGDFTVAKGDVVGINAQGKLTNVFADAVSFVVKSTNPSYVGGDDWGAGFEEDPEGLEAARQAVDRIAFAGQVPVNVLGTTPGQYIVPTDDSGTIKGIAVSNPTFEQYQLAVGKVIALEADGRARIIVKVA